MSYPEPHHTQEIQNTEYLAPKILLSDIEQNRDEWLRLRKGKISSSNVAVVCGLSPWKSPLQLWAEWTGKISDDFKGNKATQLGTALEPLVASWFAERTGLGLTKADALFVDSELPWLVCTPDYLLPSGDPLEIKTGNPRTAYKWAEGAAPFEYVLQVQIQMRVLRRNKGMLTAYLGDFENMPDVLIGYDAELFGMVREKAEEFLDCVQKDIPPAAGSGDADLIRIITKREEGTVKRWQGAEGELVTYLAAQVKDTAETCSKIRKELEKLERVKKELENRIKQAMGTATLGELPDGRTIRLSTVHVSEKVVGPYSYDRLTLPKNA